ncbi:hypothetical protein Tco_0658771 [Tanacetum coccineum]
MGEPLSPDRLFDFPVDEPEPHPAYDFFAPAPLPGYASNPNNNNGWLEADDYLLGELEAMVDEQMVVPDIEEVAEPVAAAEEEQVIAPVVGMEEEQMNAPVIDMEEDLAALFGDDDFEDDASDGFDIWEVNAEWLMASVTPPPMLAVPPSSVYEVGGPSTAAAEGPSFPLPAPGLRIPPAVIEDLGTRLGNLEYGHRQLVQRVNQVRDAEVAAGVAIEELGPRVYAVEGQVQVIVSQMAHVVDRWEQALQTDVQQRDTQIQQLQTTVTEMGSRESSLMQCILGLDRRLAALERRPPGPQ